ncbi:MAG TPA: hypothetical protein VF043_04995 [Ktedonobacteraceae bacterium]
MLWRTSKFLAFHIALALEKAAKESTAVPVLDIFSLALCLRSSTMVGECEKKRGELRKTFSDVTPPVDEQNAKAANKLD